MNLDEHKNVLVVAAHPDDEVLGCGGFISKLVQNGASVSTLFISDGVSSRKNYFEKKLWKDELEIRRAAAFDAASIMGTAKPVFYNFPDNQLDQVPLLELAKIVEDHLKTILPNLVLTHFPGDLNVDHRRVAEAVTTASRPGSKGSPSEIWAFEVPSSTEWSLIPNQNFTPNIFVDVSEQSDKKIKALEAYNFEMREFPHPRSKKAIVALMDWRASSSALTQAESFVLLRKILK